ncbi:cyclin-dependent kinase inhibitor 3 family protein [Ottowia sp.]|uniref:cyclin-dependent kinase inhibitor 3 family protein n=1 Tax=Ottowia sp. TaxID=1898956 RepID=UPI0025D376B4|nr:cyclin-dependent kinase inhibitor 3 family protein [Ottowia sp.]MBK6616509.1 cyclin-dependent kinase inhibitor 3 family protein [Ottowia sp.]
MQAQHHELPRRTSVTDPLRIDELPIGSNGALIGLTVCPGKKGSSAFGRPWERDLSADLDVVKAWGALAVVTLIEQHEFALLEVGPLGREVVARGMQWAHLPIVDQAAPDLRFENAWIEAGPMLRGLIKAGARFVIHCRGGLGRAGTVAGRLLVETGIEPSSAIALVRAARHGAIETKPQERYVLSQQAVATAPPRHIALQRQQPQVPVAR